jgi:hypothetical protein
MVVGANALELKLWVPLVYLPDPFISSNQCLLQKLVMPIILVGFRNNFMLDAW